MLNLLIGIVLGAAFSPLWIAIFNYIKIFVKSLLNR